MADNFLQPGENLTLPAPTGGTVANRVYLIGALAAVALETKAQTLPCAFRTGGVFKFPKDGSASVNFAAGERVFWDPANHRVAKTNAAHFPIGCAIAAAGNSATTVNVRLDGVATALVG